MFLFLRYRLEVDLQVEYYLIRLPLHKDYHHNHLTLHLLSLHLYLSLQHKLYLRLLRHLLALQVLHLRDRR